MKLASLKTGGRDGTLVVVDRALQRYVAVPEHALTLQGALDNWASVSVRLEEVSDRLNGGQLKGAPLNFDALGAPLPRAYQWLDGSVYLTHMERVRQARGAEMPPNLYVDPLMYQGGSDRFLGPRDPIRDMDAAWGIDLEGEVAVITDDVPQGIGPAVAQAHIRLLLLVNDISLRNLIPDELAKGFGFIHGNPASACSPVAATPDELGPSWDGARVHRPLECHVNDALLGRPEAGVGMQFGFDALVAHAAKTRSLGAGTIIGSGTVSNPDQSRGCACLMEQRVLEQIDQGHIKTPFLAPGDRVRIDMQGTDGGSIFGAIDQSVTA